jgi:hypothetical protein
MRKRAIAVLLVAVAATFLITSTESGAQSEAQSGAQFLPGILTGPEQAIPAGRASLPQPEISDRLYPRSRLATVDTRLMIQAVAGTEARLDLFDDVRLLARTTGVERVRRDEYTWRAEIVGIPSSYAKFDIVDDVVHGRIVVPGDGVYVVRYAGNGVHSVRRVDPTAFDLQDDTIGVPAPAEARAPVSTRRAAETIRYLALWSKAAKKEVGGAKALKAIMNKTVSDWNDGAEAAGIDDRLKLAKAKKLKLKDAGNTILDLLAINDATKGTVDPKAAKLRDKFKGDFVGWYTKAGPDGACGVAWRPFGHSAGNESFMYSVVQTNCNDGFSGGAHEVLHNMTGCHPKEEAGCDTVSTPYSFGYLQKKAKNVPTPRAMSILGTFVAALCPAGGASCTMLTTMSFSGGKFMGNKMGDSKANIGRMVNENAASFAAYRE